MQYGMTPFLTLYVMQHGMTPFLTLYVMQYGMTPLNPVCNAVWHDTIKPCM